ELIRKAIEKLLPGRRPIIRDANISNLLQMYSLKDESIRKAYIKFLQSEMQYLLEGGGYSDDIEISLEKLIGVRPDPNRDNDKIRMGMVFYSISDGNK